MSTDAQRDDVELKSVLSFEIKDADKGEVLALVSTMDVVDRDGDVILSGAIQDGTVVKLSAYGHDVITKNEPPVGIGTISVKGNRAYLDAQYFMETARGRDAFAMVKALGPNSEWSIGFAKRVKTAPMTDAWRAKGAQRLIAGLTIFESSPVFLGANALTGTVAVKQADGDPVDLPTTETVPAPPAIEEAPVPVVPTAPSADEMESKRGKEFGADIFARFERTRSRLPIAS